MKKKYRIVKDRFLGYECQVWRWWWPFWVQLNYCNSFRSKEQAIAFIDLFRYGAGNVVWKSDIKPKDLIKMNGL